MSDKIYKQLKKQNGEAFAKAVRNHHNGIFAIDNLAFLVRHAGRDATPLLPYFMGLLLARDEEPQEKPEPVIRDPFELLDEAGYDAFVVDTLEAQNSITPYFASGEAICTFNDPSRHQNYYMIHAIKRGAGELKRSDFRGKEKRQDAYGTSVVSIQIHKNGGFISIKNRYNHTVEGCDNTFNSNPDNIIDGLYNALKTHFNVDFTADKNPLPDNEYVMMNGQIFKYWREFNNIYYGDQAYAKDGQIHAMKRDYETMFDRYIFDHKTKTMQSIELNRRDSFPEDFNRAYADVKKQLYVKDGNLMLGDKTLIKATESRITGISLDRLITAGHGFMIDATSATHINLPNVITVGANFMDNATSATHINLPNTTAVGWFFLGNAQSLTSLYAPRLPLKNLPDHVKRIAQKTRQKETIRAFFNALSPRNWFNARDPEKNTLA